jgi:hypothetical protein
MAITTLDKLVDALANQSSRIVMDKASVANTASGQFHSLWRASGQPGTGAIPTAASVCDNTTVGCFGFDQQVAPETSYLGYLSWGGTSAPTVTEIHDRLMHMGGLSGTSITSQTVNLDLNANLATSNLDARKGDANYSDVQWWLEWYADTGATVATATVSVTYNDGTTGNLTGISLAATRRASFLVPLNNLIPAAAAGKFIRDVDSLLLSISTGTIGNFGVTATRQRAVLPTEIANFGKIFDWSQLGLPEIFNGSCLFPLMLAGGTSTGTLRGQGKIAHG